MTDLSYFDANCALGRVKHPQHGSLLDTGAVLEEARRCGIERVLAYHTLAKDWSPEVGNLELLPLLHRHDDVVGCWVAEPSVAPDTPSADRFVDTVLTQGFRVLRLCPDVSDHTYGLVDARTRLLVAALADRRVPLIIDTARPDWGGITAVAAQEPSLPLIMSGIGYRHGGALLSVLDTCPNVVIESSSFMAHGAIEEIVADYGPQRVVFGTNAPTFSMGAAVARVELADLPDDDKRQVAGQTLLDLVRGVRS